MNKKLTLIEGVYSITDARDVLQSIYGSKINFYKLKNISQQERYGKNDETAHVKIQKLQLSIENIVELIAEAKANNKMLQINSEVSISLCDN